MVARCAAIRRRGGRGFTLVEAAIAIVVVGVGIVALMHAMASGTRINSEGQAITQAVFVAQEVREWTMRLPFSDEDPSDANNPPGPDSQSPQVFVDDLDDLMEVTYGPPRDGQGVAIADLAGWSQTIHLEWRDPGSLTTAVPDGDSDVVCVTVDVGRHGRDIHSASWLVTRRQTP